MPQFLFITLALANPERNKKCYHCLTTSSLLAKFHYTGPTGPDQTKSADFIGDPRGPARTLSETRVCSPGLAKVRAGPVWPV